MFYARTKDRIDEVMRFKSNMDSGMFFLYNLLQQKHYRLIKDWYDYINKIYKERREKVYELLNELKCTYSKEQNGLFVWAKIPSAI